MTEQYRPQPPRKQQFFEDGMELSCRDKRCKAKWYFTIDKRRDNGICPYCGLKIRWPINTIAREKRRQIGGLWV
jgi:hypothetical protein